MESPSYIKSLVIPQARKAGTSRRVWSIDLESVWLPFFTATNVQGDTAIPHEAMGAPLRLALQKDGSIRFNNSGKPVIRVVREISDMVRLVRENFTAGLMSYANGVATENSEAFDNEVMVNTEAGKPLIAHDNGLLKAYAMAKAEAEATPAPAPKAEKPAPKPKARKVKTAKPEKTEADTAIPEPSNGDSAEPVKVPELVTA